MSSTTWSSSHDFSAALRGEMVTLLNRELADLIDLGLQARQAHWNVKGPHFASLHALFEEVAETLDEAADEIAERAVELGGVADGTLQAVAAGTRLVAYDRTLLAGESHLQAIAGALAGFAHLTRAGIDTAAGAGDAVTADVLTGVGRDVDKLLWKVTAHLTSGT